MSHPANDKILDQIIDAQAEGKVKNRLSPKELDEILFAGIYKIYPQTYGKVQNN